MFDEKGKRNFTTYAEIGYNANIYKEIYFSPFVGAVFNNQAMYYTYADPSKASFVNVGAKLSKEFAISDTAKIPVWICYINNPSGKEFTKPAGSAALSNNYFTLGTGIFLYKKKKDDDKK